VVDWSGLGRLGFLLRMSLDNRGDPATRGARRTRPRGSRSALKRDIRDPMFQSARQIGGGHGRSEGSGWTESWFVSQLQQRDDVVIDNQRRQGQQGDDGRMSQASSV
jgi:hypothetical protein